MRKVNRVTRMDSFKALQFLDTTAMRQKMAELPDSDIVQMVQKELVTTLAVPVMATFRRDLGIRKHTVIKQSSSGDADAVLTLLAACERKQQEQADEIERLGRNLSSALARITEMEKKFVAMGR